MHRLRRTGLALVAAHFVRAGSTCLTAVLACASVARAGDPPPLPEWAAAQGTWSSGFAAPTFDGPAAVMLPFGPGLVAAGEFERFGRTPLAHVAVWDTVAWRPLGGGTDDAVRALAVWQGSLIAAGSFEHADGIACHHVARWDGTRWSPLGDGLDGRVTALVAGVNGLVAAGDLTLPGDATPLALARWDGTHWEALAPAVVGAVTEAVEHRGRLVIAAARHVASGVDSVAILRWSPGAWQSLLRYSTSTDPLQRLLVAEDELYALGSFANGGVARPLLALGDTSWVPVADLWGVAFRAAATSAGISLAGLFRVGETTWFPFATVQGALPRYRSWLPHPMPQAMTGWGTRLVTSGVPFGWIGIMDPMRPLHAPAMLDGLHWEELRPAGEVGAGLCFGGHVPDVFGIEASADTVRVFGEPVATLGADGWQEAISVLGWTGAGWQPQVDVTTTPYPATCIARIPQGLVVGSTDRNTTASPFIQLSSGVGPRWMDGGLDGPPHRLVPSGSGLAVQGEFRHAGTLRVPWLALWDGDHWSAVPGIDTTEFVSAATAAGGALWLLGASADPGSWLARWDGTTLERWPIGSDRVLLQLGAWAGAPVAAGWQLVDGRLQPVVWRWDGAAWQPLADPHVTVHDVVALSSDGADLFALGEVALDGVERGIDVARWDGRSWTLLDARVDGPAPSLIHDIVALHGELWMVGRFSSVAGVGSYGVARWSPTAAGARVNGTLRAAPDPFPDAVELSFVLARGGRTRVDVFDVSGRRVRALLDGALTAGGHHLRWDGRDDDGRSLPAGVYLARVRAEGEPAATRRVVRLR